MDDSRVSQGAPVCRTLLVTSKATVGGMGESEFGAIRDAAGLAP